MHKKKEGDMQHLLEHTSSSIFDSQINAHAYMYLFSGMRATVVLRHISGKNVYFVL
jgi:hypothetical protein